MRHRSFLLLVGLLIGVNTFAQRGDELMKIFHSIRSAEVFGYADTLSSERFKGRLAGTPEYMDAANWVADHLKSWGVKPAMKDGSYFQTFKSNYTKRNDVGIFSVVFTDRSGREIKKSYRFPDDYLPGSNSGTGDVNAEVVYVGYGITAPELKYDDYKGVDVKGKVIILEAGIPYKGKEEEVKKQWAVYASSALKVENAVKHGAAAVLHVGMVGKPGYPYSDKLVYNHVSDGVVSELFYGSGKEYKALKKRISEKMRPQSLELKHKVRLTAETERFNDNITGNVIGLIEGSDPELKDEVIILGAHLDGQGSPGALFAGALDNASGCANLMAIAKAFSQLKERPKRSVMFIFYGAEEIGLVGSRFYSEHPLFPMEKTVCVVNMDMVGNGNSFVLTRVDSDPLLRPYFVDTNDKYIHRALRTYKARRTNSRPRTDGHLLFNKGYRAYGLWIGGREKPLYYHHPYDTKETLTPEIMEDVAKWMFLSVEKIANDSELDIKKL